MHRRWRKFVIFIAMLGLCFMVLRYWFDLHGAKSAQSTSPLSEEAFNQGKDTKPAVNSAAVASVIADSSNAPSGTPLMQLRDKLEPHAAAGDLAAAARLAHDATNCAYSDYDISWMQALIENASRDKPEVAQRHRQLLAALPEKIAAAQKVQKTVCTGVSRLDAI